jgi:hypothetical protein
VSEIAVTADTALVLPHTGELINLNDAPVVAGHLRELRDLESKIREAKGILTDALVAESQRQGTKTMYLEGVGKVELTGGPGSEVQWDLDILSMLVDAGLPQDRYDALVTTNVSFSVNSAVAKQLEASGNERYRELVQMARKRADRRWSARVS